MSNKFIDSLTEYKAMCDKYISGNELKSFLSSFELDGVMGEYIDALISHSDGGKRIRAFLVAVGYCLFKGFDNYMDVLLPSLSYELFQTGILAHDDIIDNSNYRRYKPSMHKSLGDGHDGVSKSICVGDFGIVSAIEILRHCGFDDSVVLRAVSHQNKVFSATIAGELKDIEFSYSDNVSEDAVLDMYRLKTAQYTVSGPLVLGAVFANACEKSLSLLSQFGDAVGISFQIRDDILGMFGDEQKLGKSILSDMCEGKKTVLVSHFDKVSSQDDKERFYSVYGKENSGLSELEIARELLVSNGSMEYSQNLCEQYTRKAMNLLCQMDIQDDGRELLTGLLEYMTNRNN